MTTVQSFDPFDSRMDRCGPDGAPDTWAFGLDAWAEEIAGYTQPPGGHYGPFRPTGLINQSNMGLLLSAVETDLDDRPVALKMTHPRHVGDLTLAARLRREVHVAARL